MSWDIYMYAEVKSKKDSDWRPLIIPAISDEFKHLNDGFVDDLPWIFSKEVSHPSVKSLNDSLYGYDSDGFKVQYCSLSDLRKHYFNVVKEFNTLLSSVYMALGIRVNADEDDYVFEDDCEDNHRQSIFDKMTFPVNKELFRDLFTSMCRCSKAHQVLGLCDSISGMCDNYDDEVRLLFVTL